MGFESSRVARRRLASLAATNDRIQEALAPSSFPGLFAGESGVYPALVADSSPDDCPSPAITNHTTSSTPGVTAASTPPALVQHLDALAHDIVSTPGAGGALLASYAAQARALTLVLEAARRAEGCPLPAAVLLAAQHALTPPQALAGLAFI